MLCRNKFIDLIITLALGELIHIGPTAKTSFQANLMPTQAAAVENLLQPHHAYSVKNGITH